MQIIQNFQKTTPTQKLLKAYSSPSGEVPIFLKSEDGQDWYACQSLFADDTVKIAYDSDGVIRAVVDKPIPERGNIYAVSMLFPDGLSVAELAVADYPVDCSIDGTWKFDGEKVFQDTSVIDEKTLRSNTGERNRLARQAAVAIATIQASAAVGKPRAGESDNLLQLQQYLDALRDVDLNAPVWPPEPDILK